MPLTRAKSDSIDAGAITADKIAAGAVTAEKVAQGVGGGPKIASIVYPGDDTAALPAGGQTIIINGSGFQSGCSVILEGAAVSVVTFVSATQLQITAPAKATGTYPLYVVNPDGGTAIRVPGLVYSGTPTWTTASGSLGTPYETNAFSVNLAATGDGSLTYAVSAGSSLPAGISLTSGGLLSGTVPVTAVDTTYTFNVDVTDSENQSTTRQFSVTYKTDVVTWSSPAAGASFAWAEGSANSTSLTAASAAGKSVSFAVQSGSLPANVTIAGNLITGTPSTVQANTAVTVRATAATTNRFADQILYFTVASGNPNRAVFAGGFSTSINNVTNVIDYVTITTLGDAADFGDLDLARYGVTGCSSTTRGVFGGGFAYDKSFISYVQFSTLGNAIFFGGLQDQKYYSGACSSSTRGVWAGGTPDSYTRTMRYVTLATDGYAQTFGNLTIYVYGLAGCSSPTRGIFGGGDGGTPETGFGLTNVIQYITIASTGDATDFGDLTAARNYISACSSDVRGLFGGGYTTNNSNVIDYITIASLGNATDFGDLSVARQKLAGCSSNTRGLFAGGTTGSDSNVIDYVTIASAGNATDFGDLTQSRYGLAACSSNHGGLQ